MARKPSQLPARAGLPAEAQSVPAPDGLAQAAQHARLGQMRPAACALLPVPDDQMCRAVDRLVQLVRRQEEQIQALQAMLETML